MNLVNVLATGYCSGGSFGDGIPIAIGNLVHVGVLIIQIVVPILLILWGMLDFTKAIIGQDEDKIKAGQKKFIQRLIAAIFVFLIVVIVRLVIGVVGSLSNSDGTTTDGNNANNAWKCASQLIDGKPSSLNLN